MAIKPIDARTLWARSGNRCAICKVELTPEGGTTTLGQMCHIVGRSNEGPRGLEPIEGYERDGYDNLILLCRNDHGRIDDNVDAWPVSKLRDIKSNHESWVAGQLSSSTITISEFNNVSYLSSREEKWLSNQQPTTKILALSLTPLRISDDVVDTTEASVMQALNEAKISDYEQVLLVNSNQSRMSPNGIRNESLTVESYDQKHSIEIHRTGHLEYVIYFTDEQSIINHKEKLFIRYSSLALSVSLGIDWLMFAWKRILPFNDMHLQCRLLNVGQTNLFSQELGYGRHLVGKEV